MWKDDFSTATVKLRNTSSALLCLGRLPSSNFIHWSLVTLDYFESFTLLLLSVNRVEEQQKKYQNMKRSQFGKWKTFKRRSFITF